jgi:hypothetical protein
MPIPILACPYNMGLCMHKRFGSGIVEDGLPLGMFRMEDVCWMCVSPAEAEGGGRCALYAGRNKSTSRGVAFEWRPCLESMEEGRDRAAWGGGTKVCVPFKNANNRLVFSTKDKRKRIATHWDYASPVRPAHTPYDHGPNWMCIRASGGG